MAIMKKALVYYLYGTRNAGDMAICVGTIEVLRKKGFDITMVSRFSESEEEYFISKAYINKYFPDVKVVPGPFSFERDYSAAQKLAAYGKSFAKVCGLAADRVTKSLIKDADVVFFNGGNLLRGESAKDYLRLMALFYPVQEAYKAGKPVYCLPQSTAGISRIGKNLLQRYLKCFSRIYIRENRSLSVLREQFPEYRFDYCIDMAFFSEDTELAASSAKEKYAERFADSAGSAIADNAERSEHGNIALVFRNTGIGDIGRISSDLEEKMFDALRAYVQSNPEKEFWITVQTLKDREISEKFLNSVCGDARVHLIEDHDPLMLREVYKQMDAVITNRLHAGILALSSLVPVAGVFCSEWGLKNPGIMEVFGMPYLMADQEDVDVGKLIDKIPADASVRIADTIDNFRDVLKFD